MNKRRLLKMADFVETIPRKQFDMATFHARRSCGTVGCAMGWAAEKRLFRGLSKRDSYDWSPRYNGRFGFGAIEDLFTIDNYAAWILFTDRPRNSTPKQVARNIRRYVATGELP